MGYLMEHRMDWKKLLSELIDTGMTQTAIASEVGVSQGAIAQVLNDKTGKRRGFKYESGARLIELHKSRVVTAG